MPGFSPPREARRVASNFAFRAKAKANRTSCSSRQGPARAVDGYLGGSTHGWCATGRRATLTVSLQRARQISAVTLFHAQAGGFPARSNTRDFTVQVSADGRRWTTVASIRRSRASVTTHLFRARTARSVRVVILRPGQGKGETARIQEVEVHDDASLERSGTSTARATAARATGTVVTLVGVRGRAAAPSVIASEAASALATAESAAPGPVRVAALIEVPGLEQIGRADLEAAAALYSGERLFGDAQRLEVGRYVLDRGNLGRVGSAARSLDIAVGYEAVLCSVDGACVTLPAGRHDRLAPSVSGRLSTVVVEPATP